MGTQAYDIPVANIVPNPGNPRKAFDEEALGQLAASILEVGVLQPLVVVKHEETPGMYRLVAGERRWRAAKLVGSMRVPCVVRDLTRAQEAEVMLIENLQRADLDPIEEARAYAALLADHGHTQEALAAKLGVSQPHIANRLRLIELPASIQEDISRGILSASHGKELLAHKHLPAPILEAAVANIKERGAPVRQVKAIIDIQTTDYGRSVRPGSVPFDSKECCVGCDDLVADDSSQYNGLPWRMTCVNLTCYEQKMQEARAAEQAKIEKLLKNVQDGSVMKDNAGKRIRDFSYNQYQRLDYAHEIKFDRRVCDPCNKKAPLLDYDGKPVMCCLEPSCFKRKNMAVSKAANKERRTALQAEFDEIGNKAREMAEAAIEDGEGSFAFLPKEHLLYIAAHILAGVKGYDTREITAYKYMDKVFNIKSDAFKDSSWGMTSREWETTRGLLECLPAVDLLRIIFEWPAVARGYEGPEKYLLKGADPK